MNTERDKMIDYYAQRAAEYERIYCKPERQVDLCTLKEFLSCAFPQEQVLEVACGTGYWTQFIAKSAKAILATDFNSNVIDLARRKNFGACHVKFAEADAYSLYTISGDHTAGFHGFWWSHVPTNKIRQFLSVFHPKLPIGAKVVMIDNAYVEGSSTPISRQDSDGNTYQLRRLDDGSEYEVLKNFPSNSDLHASLSAYATDIRVNRLHYFWIAEYKTIEMPNQLFGV
jgi:demethylmenaquinone methyltransferase/2-methoxy-6-polyprenyl-1,4-benzoquinol methylase